MAERGMADDRRDRVLGLLLGTALGDALGAPFEGRTLVSESALRAHTHSSAVLRHTDDTALTLALAEHLARGDAGDPLAEDALAADFVAAWRAEPWRGYGAAAARLFHQIGDGAGWRESARGLFDGQGSYGNGAAMRVAPVVAVSTGPHHAADLARRTAAITHAHEDGQQGAALQATAACLALVSDPGRPVDPQVVLDDLARVVRSRPWHAKLERVVELLSAEALPRHAAHALGNDVTALGSVPTALLAYLTSPDDPAAVVSYAIRAGGDTDTIAAMAGALAGARNGAGAFPSAWVDRLEAADRLRSVADRLALHLPERQ
jgi:poly(ADP-ribose) glycohydrolase ARH3